MLEVKSVLVRVAICGVRTMVDTPTLRFAQNIGPLEVMVICGCRLLHIIIIGSIAILVTGKLVPGVGRL